VANGILNVSLGSMVMGRAPAAMRGRIAATVGATASAGQIIAFVAGGLIGSAITPREVFALAGTLGLLAPLLFGRALIRAASRPATQPADSAAVEVVGAAA
jgi:MFS family permease